MRFLLSSDFLKISVMVLTVCLLTACQSKDTGLAESRFFTDSIQSTFLESSWKHHIYLPKGFTPKKNYPIIYSTDGNDETSYRFIHRTLDSLISSRLIQPVIYVGSFANNKEVPNSSIQTEDGQTFSLHYRFFEYVESNPQYERMPGTEQIFDNHMRYFTEELIPTIEAAYEQELSAKDRYFYGYSNGAGFGANLLNKQPELLGTFICFSTIGSGVEWQTWNSSTQYPNLFLKYGSLEGAGYVEEALALKSVYKDSGSTLELKIFEGGHQIELWNDELVKTLVYLFK